MKKFLISLIISFFFVSNLFAYNPTEKDTTTLNNIYSKIDLIYQKNPDSIQKIYNKIEKDKDKYIKNEEIFYLLSSISDYISKKTSQTEENKTYLVKKVVDWDTIDLNYDWKDISIRFIWIDSPESYVTRFWYKECYWDEAKKYLKNLIEEKNITIEFDESQWKTDKYWRTLAYIFLNWVNINWEMIKNWYAWEYTYSKKYKYQDEFKVDQKNASDSKVWLWTENTCNWERRSLDETITKDSPKHIYILWPKWWCYYLNTSWNKVYVDKSNCWNTSTWSIDNNTSNLNYQPTTNSTTSTSTSSSSRNYYTWPRWWCYYINSSWNKSYVDHSFCN